MSLFSLPGMAHLLHCSEARQKGLGGLVIILEHGECYEQRCDNESASAGEVLDAACHHFPEQGEGFCVMTNCSPGVCVGGSIAAG